MNVTEFALFPTRLVTIEFPDAAGLNRELGELFATKFQGDFDMHPDALNLLRMADAHPCVARLGEMFQAGLRRWLAAENIQGEFTADVVLFSNYAVRGDFTQVHNHNADVVGIYYVQTADYGRPPVALPDPNGDYDYFAADDGVLTLHDPRFNANLAAVRSTDYAKVFPKPGLMLLFPGYLWHSVTPHLGEFKRLAISANFKLRSAATASAVSWPLRLGPTQGESGPG